MKIKILFSALLFLLMVVQTEAGAVVSLYDDVGTEQVLDVNLDTEINLEVYAASLLHLGVPWLGSIDFYTVKQNPLVLNPFIPEQLRHYDYTEIKAKDWDTNKIILLHIDPGRYFMALTV